MVAARTLPDRNMVGIATLDPTLATWADRSSAVDRRGRDAAGVCVRGHHVQSANYVRFAPCCELVTWQGRRHTCQRDWRPDAGRDSRAWGDRGPDQLRVRRASQDHELVGGVR